MKMLIVNNDSEITGEERKNADVILDVDGMTITIIKSCNPKMVPEGYKVQQTNENMQKIIAYFI